MNINIRTSELMLNGVNPSLWQRLSIFDKKRLASVILHQRNTQESAGQAFAIESNNPNAIQGLRLVQDVPG